jgi:hypothetical protein
MELLQSGDDMMIVFLVNCCSYCYRPSVHRLRIPGDLKLTVRLIAQLLDRCANKHLLLLLCTMRENDHDRATQFLASTFTLLAISWLVYFCRLYTRLWLVKRWFLEDYFITIGMARFQQG